MARRDRYREFEQLMTIGLLACTGLFVLYLIAGISWLKAIFAILAIGISVGGLVMLWLSQELLRPRSLWLSCGFFSVIACTLASLILAFP